MELYSTNCGVSVLSSTHTLNKLKLLISILLFNTVSSRKRLLPEAVPTLNLPTKSVESSPVTPRQLIKKFEPPSPKTSQSSSPLTQGSTMSMIYRDLDSLKAKMKNLKLTGWVTNVKDEEIWFKHFDLKHVSPKFSLKVDSGLNFSLFVYGWLLCDAHPLYVENKRSL